MDDVTEEEPVVVAAAKPAGGGDEEEGAGGNEIIFLDFDTNIFYNTKKNQQSCYFTIFFF